MVLFFNDRVVPLYRVANHKLYCTVCCFHIASLIYTPSPYSPFYSEFIQICQYYWATTENVWFRVTSVEYPSVNKRHSYETTVWSLPYTKLDWQLDFPWNKSRQFISLRRVRNMNNFTKKYLNQKSHLYYAKQKNSKKGRAGDFREIKGNGVSAELLYWAILRISII